MNERDRLKEAKSIIKKKRSVEDELYDMFTMGGKVESESVKQN
jgi:hypothetical protein